MNAELLLAHFNRISDAPDAVQRLRRFILDLAVRGKLVDQNPSEVPALQLIADIEAVKKRLILDGRIRKQQPPRAILPQETPFDLPPKWEWIRLGEIGATQTGATPPKEAASNFGKHIPFIKPGDICSNGVDYGNEGLSEVGLATSGRVAPAGSILMVCIGTIGKCQLIDRDCSFNQQINSLSPFGSISPRYLLDAMQSEHFQQSAWSASARTTIAILNKGKWELLPVPLPPLAEQHRIVTKVDELMALCDRLEVTLRERESRRDRLTAATHHHLNNGADVDALRVHAQFFIGHLPRLTARPAQIKQLRQAILNLAVRGLLTHHLDEFVPVLNARGTRDLVADFRIPTGWLLQPLTEVASAVVDCPHSTPKWTTEGKICVRTNQFRPGRLDLSEVRFVSESTYLERIQRLEPVENDILYSREGGILGVACRVPANVQLCLGQRMMLIRPARSTDAAFLEMVLNSPFITQIAKEETTGGAAPRINVATVKAYGIPVPPLDEQHRIVAKVDELMALCDQLEARLTTAQTEASRLLESVLHNALNSPVERLESALST